MAKKAVSNKLTIKTSKLQEMVARAIKGAGNNKNVPISQMMAIQLVKNELTLITTDATNTLFIREEKVEGKDFSAVVQADVFSKLVQRTTADTITMEIVGRALMVKGNGNYTVNIEEDDDGTMVIYPDPRNDVVFDPEETIEINTSTINKILNILKPALYTFSDDNCYCGYYVGDKAVATDTFLINILNVSMFNQPKLISSVVMDLLSIMKAEKIKVDIKDNVMMFSTPDCTVFSREMEGIEDFDVDSISQFAEMDFASMCKLSKSVLLQALDRLALFVTDFDEGEIQLVFTKDGLQINSKESSAVEVIPFIESDNFKNFICPIDVKQFITQIKTQTGETVELWYGNESALKLVRDNVIQLLAIPKNSTEEEAEPAEDEEAVPFN